MKTVTSLPWVKTTPTVQGWYWHWNGDEDSAPSPLSVLWSGTSGKCFVSMGQAGISEAVDCDVYGGWWLELKVPETPNYLVDGPGVKALDGCFPIVLYFQTVEESSEFVDMVKQSKPNMVSSRI
jgi:hypothetical protein